MADLSEFLDSLGGITPEEIRKRVNGWSYEGKDAFDERAGIMEYDGRLGRDEAEAQAYEILRVEFENREEDTDG